MPTETKRDLLRCPDGKMHAWVYLGKVSKKYRCRDCPEEAAKAEIKRATDA